MKEMKYKEFLNFSVYQFDIDKYNGDWKRLQQMLRSYDLSGVELLLNFDSVPDTIPKEIVGAVHFPSFMGWYRVWTDSSFKIPDDIDDELINYIYGGRKMDEITANFCKCISYAAKTDPAYGVYHAGYMEAEHTFSRKKCTPDREVLKATAEFLNSAVSSFPGGEPPFDIAIENLWWPGLTFLDPQLTLEFMDMLEFERWFFMLDTGHLMSASGDCFTEDDGIDLVLCTLKKLDRRVIEKIKGLHLHFSASGKYQQSLCEPDNFHSLEFSDKLTAIMNHLKFFDEHRPFTSKRCREIVDFVSPDYITHEFTGRDAEGIKEALLIQKNALSRDK